MIPHRPACSLQLLRRLGGFLCPAHLLHLIVQEIAGCLCRCDHGGGALARLFRLLLSGGGLFAYLRLGVRLEALEFLPQALCLLALLLHLHAAGLQLLNDVFKALVLGADQRLCPADDVRRQPQLLGNRKRIGFTWRTDNQPIGRF